MSDYIVNFTLEELKEVLNESSLPLRFIDRTKVQEAFDTFCVKYDESMLPHINFNNFELASHISKNVSPTFERARKANKSDLFFELVLYFDIDFRTFKDNFLLVFDDSLFSESFLEKYKAKIYDQIYKIEDNILPNPEKLDNIKYSGLNIGPANRKTLLVALGDIKTIPSNNYKEILISNRLCLSLKIEELKSKIKACYYKNEIVNIDMIGL